MCRLVMGNKPSANLSTIAVRKTAELHDFPTLYPAVHRTLTEDTYVDNVLIVSPTLARLKSSIKDVEYVASQGGFYFKPWVIAGQDVPQHTISISLPSAIAEDEEKALGLSWDVSSDHFSIKPGLLVGDRKRTGRAAENIFRLVTKSSGCKIGS